MMSVDEADALRLIAEELVGEAMVRCERIGLRRMDGARVALGIAYALAVSKCTADAHPKAVNALIDEALRFAAETTFAFRLEDATRLKRPAQ